MKCSFVFLATLYSFLFLSSCLKKEEPRIVGNLKSSKFRGMLFTGHKNYDSSTVYWHDFQTGELKEILRGQSGDPKLFLGKEKIYLFNRAFRQSNLVLIDPQKFSASKEQSLNLEVGDPHSVLEVENGLLASCPVNNSLEFLDLKENSHKTLYQSDNFIPGNFFVQKKEDKTFSLYIPSRGKLNLQLVVENSQKIYAFSYKDSPKKELRFEKTYPAYSSFSDSLLSFDFSDEFFSFSLGYRDFKENKASFDSFKLSQSKLHHKQINPLDSFPHLSSCGDVILGKKNTLYTSVKNTRSGRVEVLEFLFQDNSSKLTSNLIHSFDNPNTHPPLLIYDKSNHCLFIGEGSPTGGAKVHLYCQNKPYLSYKIDLNPYQGILVP